jgi:hypothetical protein
MSLAFVAALALSPTATAAQCSWDRPGVDPFMGNIPAAVDRYTDIPADVRARLKARMAKRQYDEIATIRRDSITGRHRYSEELRDMHFGQGRVCRTVTRTRWAPDTVERGLVYCEAEHCIIVPTVCRNVSRVTRLPGGPVAAPGGEGGLPGTLLAGPGSALPPAETTSTALAANDTVPTDELIFDPPSAGTSFAEASQPLPALPPIAGFGGFGSGIPGTVGGVPIDGSSSPGRVPESALDVPVGVAPIGSGTIGGGGIIPTLPPTPVDPPLVIDPPVPVIPEPGTWMMWLAGLGAMTWLVRRRRP